MLHFVIFSVNKINDCSRGNIDQSQGMNECKTPALMGASMNEDPSSCIGYCPLFRVQQFKEIMCKALDLSTADEGVKASSPSSIVWERRNYCILLINPISNQTSYRCVAYSSQRTLSRVQINLRSFKLISVSNQLTKIHLRTTMPYYFRNFMLDE